MIFMINPAGSSNFLFNNSSHLEIDQFNDGFKSSKQAFLLNKILV